LKRSVDVRPTPAARRAVGGLIVAIALVRGRVRTYRFVIFNVGPTSVELRNDLFRHLERCRSLLPTAPDRRPDARLVNA
jgi:hypothetical protein